MSAHAAHWRGRPLSAVLFDLDGTLLDTLADIAAALNLAMADHGFGPVPENDVRQMIGRGSPMLIQRAVSAGHYTVDAAGQAHMLERFFHHYGEQEESGQFAARPYPGAAQALQRLHEAGLRTGVVTNKHQRFASGLLEKLNLKRWIDVVVGGDTCERRKPDPQPLLYACESLQVTADAVLMVGDSINDVKAARAAKIPVVCVPYGYNEGQDPRSLDCDAMVDSLDELPALLGVAW